MDVAGVVIGSIALLLSLFGSAYAGVQLTRAFRFRQPKVFVEEGELPARHEEGCTIIGPGSIDVSIRGASRSMTLSGYDIIFPQSERGAVSSPKKGLNIQIATRSYHKLTFQIDTYVISTAGEPPQEYAAYLVLRTPDETLPPTTIALYRADDATRYYVGLPFEWAQRTSRRVMKARLGWRRNALQSVRRRLGR